MAKRMSLSISEINGEEDHIHFLLETTPQDNLGSVIGALKVRSSSYLHNKYTFPYWGKHSRTLWSSEYFVVSTGGAPLDVIKKYIQNQ
jgi:putative transposase